MLRTALASTLLLGLLLTARSADACSPPQPGYFGSIPESGTTIPRNASIAILGYGEPTVSVFEFDFGFNVESVVEDGIRFVPLEDYMLVGEISVTAEVEFGAPPLTQVFIVDPEEDDEPPEFDGEITSISYEWLEDEPGLCQSGGFHLTITAEPARDDWGVTAYVVRELLPNDGVRTVGHTFHRPQDAEVQVYAYGGVDPGTRCFGIFARDVASNETPAFFRGNVTCVDLQIPGTADAGVTVDAGSIDTGTADAGRPDSGAKPDSGTTGPTGSGLRLERDQGGCGCAASETEAGSFGWLLLFGLLFLVRRVR